jgi:FAD/FMN-containing dehydrogenase
VGRVGADETAFANREAPFVLNLISTWTEPTESEHHIEWARDTCAALQPFSTGGVYVNFLDRDEGEARVRAAYGENYERLASLKAKYDPTNFFHLNQNIKPS